MYQPAAGADQTDFVNRTVGLSASAECTRTPAFVGYANDVSTTFVARSTRLYAIRSHRRDVDLRAADRLGCPCLRAIPPLLPAAQRSADARVGTAIRAIRGYQTQY